MLKELISPISVNDFFENYFEKKPLLVKRNNPDYFNSIISNDDFENVLFSMNNVYPETRIVNYKEGVIVDKEKFTLPGSDQIDPIKFVRMFTEGATMVLSGLHKKINSMRKLGNQLSNDFKLPIQTNVYITPPNEQGFTSHFDNHDVFVVQFKGKKKWRIYDNYIDLPTRAMEFDKEKHKPGPISQEFMLEQGDFLYIPRGWMHDANTIDHTSGHITIGLVGDVWGELLSKQIIEATKEHLILRKRPKFNSFYDNDTTEEEEIESLVKDILFRTRKDKAITEEFDAVKSAYFDGMVKSVFKIDELNKSSEIKISDKENLKLIEYDECLELKFYNIQMNLPLELTNIINQLIVNDTITINDLDQDYTIDSRIELVQELVKNGIVVIL